MQKLVIFFLSMTILFGVSSLVNAQEEPAHHDQTEQHDVSQDHDDHEAHADADHEAHASPASWSVIPFVILLLMIATGPLFFEHFWHKFYPVVAITLAVIVVGYYLIWLGDTGGPIHALAEYVQFIALLGSLFMASGGILINVDKEGKPMTNVMILLIGAVIANLIGTTGASMLLIRPFIRLNKDNIRPFHIMFFIFIVSNVGGSLTPIGDPPLFLGFLKGVPFEWTITHNFVPWVFGIGTLVTMFFFIDKRNSKKAVVTSNDTYTGAIKITGTKNFAWLGIIIIAVFIDPNIFPGIVPGITLEVHGHVQTFSYIREVIMLSVAFLSYRFADERALKGNEFEFEPIREVAFIFIGIFGTMTPALQMVGEFAKSPEGQELINANNLYWGTGVLSGVLDNAPTYMNFFTAAISAGGGNVNDLQSVRDFTSASGVFAGSTSVFQLMAISIGAVFFGAMTYIGNGPNFMVKAIAEQVGISMPSFFGYVIRFSLPFLLPVLILTWLIFFYFGFAEVIGDWLN